MKQRVSCYLLFYQSRFNGVLERLYKENNTTLSSKTGSAEITSMNELYFLLGYRHLRH